MKDKLWFWKSSRQVLWAQKNLTTIKVWKVTISFTEYSNLKLCMPVSQLILWHSVSQINLLWVWQHWQIFQSPTISGEFNSIGFLLFFLLLVKKNCFFFSFYLFLFKKKIFFFFTNLCAESWFSIDCRVGTTLLCMKPQPQSTGFLTVQSEKLQTTRYQPRDRHSIKLLSKNI